MVERNDKEGWTWLRNSKQWHYFREGRSLCGKFALFVKPQDGFEIGNNESKNNCTGCKKKILKEVGNSSHK